MTDTMLRPPPTPPPPPPGYGVVAVKKYEAIVPMDTGEVESDETVASTKEEEWVTKRTTELTTTRQIETRVKRQVVLEDGEVVEDSGPIVSTNTTEDTEKQEHETTEHRTLGDPNAEEEDDDEIEALTDGATAGSSPSGTSHVASNKVVKRVLGDGEYPEGLVREVKERRVLSREETEELVETEDIKHLGDITDEGYLAAVNTGAKDIRPALISAQESTALVPAGPRIVHQSTKTHKVVDTEDTEKKSIAQPDGKIITESKKTTEHEEIVDEDLPEDEAQSLDSGSHCVDHKEASQRFKNTKDSQAVQYVVDGRVVGTEMRYAAETREGEREGDVDPMQEHWESLSDRMRRARRQGAPGVTAGRTLMQRQREAAGVPLDRKDALTKRPLDFDQEEETRKVETSKWLEHHFGSDSRSSRGSTEDDLEPEHTTTNSYFNVTIKSQPSKPDIHEEPTRGPNRYEENGVKYVAKVNASSKVFVPSPEVPINGKYFQGVSEWSERRPAHPRGRSPPARVDKVYDNSLKRLTKQNNIQRDDSAYVSSSTFYTSPTGNRSPEILDRAEIPDPIPPQRKRALERRMKSSEESGYKTREEEPAPDYSPPPRRASPAHHSPSPHREQITNGGGKKSYQKTRFASETSTPAPPATPVAQKQTVGAAIGQSIRKLVGKIRSASAERKNKMKAKRLSSRSPSPHKTSSYMQYNGTIDSHITCTPPVSSYSNGGDIRSKRTLELERSGSPELGMASPVQKYYLGEDPYGGSIYGKENKYDGVKPQRTTSRRHHRPQELEEEYRPQVQHTTTLGRFNKSSNRVQTNSNLARSVQTLPRKLNHESPQHQRQTGSPAHQGSTINVSIVNNVNSNLGPAKPARTYKSSLSRSKSFNVHAGQINGQDYNRNILNINLNKNNSIYKSNPHLNESVPQLKSPGIVSLISRSQKDLTTIAANGHSDDKRTVFLKGLQDRAPELFKTLHGEEPTLTSTPLKKEHHVSSIYRHVNGNSDKSRDYISKNDYPVHKTEIYSSPGRRGSSSTDDYSETYRMTSKSDDPKRPSVTNTVQSFSKRTVPSRDGRSKETIESTETKTYTTSRYRGEPMSNLKYLESGRRGSGSGSGSGGVVIEVRNLRK